MVYERENKITTDGWHNWQRRVLRGTNIFVFLHNTYVTASSAKYVSFESCISIRITEPYLDECNNTDHHFFQPFFRNNVSLKRSWHSFSELLEEIYTHDMDSGMFASRNNFSLSGFQYTDNTWTRRLAGALIRHLPQRNI